MIEKGNDLRAHNIPEDKPSLPLVSPTTSTSLMRKEEHLSRKYQNLCITIMLYKKGSPKAILDNTKG